MTQKILIVDDIRPNVLLLAGILNRLEDVEVVTFTDPVEALSWCVTNEPDLVLLDYLMPEMDGCEFLRRFRNMGHLSDVPVVVVTIDQSRDALYRALEAGANDFLRKPVDDAELIARARNMLLLQARQIDLKDARREAEASNVGLVTAMQEAEIANRTKSEFLANMSHELRTPLNAIIGFSEIIKDETFGPVGSAKYRDYADDINVSGQHLLSLINDILDLSKIEAGTGELHEENIEILGLASVSMNLVAGLDQAGKVELELMVPDDIPALHADKRKVQQMLLNLLSNAIKFTPDGGRVTLKISACSESGYLFQVSDTGIGIAFEDIPIALAPFQQIDSGLSRNHDGTGLGLPLTKALVEMHGGTLDLQSEVGVGTTVTVHFPTERIVSSTHDAQAHEAVDRKVS